MHNIVKKSLEQKNSEILKKIISDDTGKMATISGVHKCTLKCFPGNPPKICCRMAYDRKLAEKTDFFELEKTIENDVFRATKLTDIAPPVPETKTESEQALPKKDKRVIQFGLKRLTPTDQAQVEYNPITSYLLRCNTSIQFLMTTTSCKNSIYYIANYMSKHPLEINNALSIIYAAMINAKKYPSKAEDAGSETRNAKYLLTKILNKLNSTVEVSDHQAVMLLLGKRSFYSTHAFSFCFIWQVIKNYSKKIRSLQNDSEDKISENEVPTETGTTSVLDTDEKGTVFRHNQYVQYLNRGPELKNYSLSTWSKTNQKK